MNYINLNLGCGTRIKKNYINVDTKIFKGIDIVCDIEKGLPFKDNSIDNIYSNFLFEHIRDIIGLFQELNRVSRSGTVIEFRVPYYQSVTQYKDPTHRSIITPEMLRYFSDDNWYGSDYNINTNFKIIDIKYHYLKPFHYMMKKYLFFLYPITYPIVLFARRFLWNVVHSITIKIQVIK